MGEEALRLPPVLFTPHPTSHRPPPTWGGGHNEWIFILLRLETDLVYPPRWALSETISLLSQPLRPTGGKKSQHVGKKTNQNNTSLFVKSLFLEIPFFSFLSPSSNRPGRCMTTPLPVTAQARANGGCRNGPLPSEREEKEATYQSVMCF